MKKMIVRGVLAALLMFAFQALAQDAPKIDGNWSLKMAGPGGEELAIPFTLKVESGVITGEFQLGDRTLKIEEGILEGSKVSWTLKRQRGDGSSMVYKMTGKVESADKLSGNTSADMGGQNVDMPWSAVRK